jgi:hypothetical protein
LQIIAAKKAKNQENELDLGYFIKDAVEAAAPVNRLKNCDCD